MDKDIDLKNFLEVERKYNLYEDTIEGIHYWVYARWLIWSNIILKEKYELGSAHNINKNNLCENIKLFTNLLRNTFINPNMNKKNVEILFITHPRRVLKDGFFRCIYTEELSKQFNNSVILEQPYQWKHLEPFEKHNVILMDYLLLKKGMFLLGYKFLFRRKYYSLLENVKSHITKVVKELEQKYELVLNIQQVADVIVTQIIFYKASVKSMKKLIDRLNPKVVVEVVGYNPFCMLANEICNTKGIPVIELQHGMIQEHIAYTYLSKKKIVQLPNRIFLFSEYWESCVNFPIEEKNCISTGFPFYERTAQEAKEIKEYSDKINILFLSQGIIGKELSKFAVELSKIIDEQKYRIIYKLHPGEYTIWEKEYNELMDENIIVVYDNKYSLYEYFATCQIQVGVNSTAIYEGVGFGIETYIYNHAFSETMMELCNKNYAKIVSSVDELYANIKDFKLQKCIKQEIWKENALENMVYSIKELL